MDAAGNSAQWNSEQLANAQLIISVGQEMGMSTRDITTALMTAMTESSLMNLNYGDRDSLGLFQQRPSQGWGSSQQIMNPIYSTQKFYSALRGVTNRNQMSMGQAAQAVQRSANPLAYNQYQNSALRLMGQLGQNVSTPYPPQAPTADLSMLSSGTSSATTPTVPGATTATTPGIGAATSDASNPTGLGASATTAALQTGTADLTQFPALAQLMGQNGSSSARQEIINAAEGEIGTPYSWGGGGTAGASYGVAQGSGIKGFDCSGLVQYALSKAGLSNIPRVSYQQLSMAIGSNVGTNQGSLQPGDLIGMEAGGHIAIYIGNGQMIEAPHTGEAVKITQLPSSGWWGVHLNIPGSATSSASSTASALNALEQSSNVSSYAGLGASTSAA